METITLTTIIRLTTTVLTSETSMVTRPTTVTGTEYDDRSVITLIQTTVDRDSYSSQLSTVQQRQLMAGIACLACAVLVLIWVACALMWPSRFRAQKRGEAIPMTSREREPQPGFGILPAAPKPLVDTPPPYSG